MAHYNLEREHQAIGDVAPIRRFELLYKERQMGLFPPWMQVTQVGRALRGVGSQGFMAYPAQALGPGVRAEHLSEGTGLEVVEQETFTSAGPGNHSAGAEQSNWSSTSYQTDQTDRASIAEDRATTSLTHMVNVPASGGLSRWNSEVEIPVM